MRHARRAWTLRLLPSVDRRQLCYEPLDAVEGEHCDAAEALQAQLNEDFRKLLNLCFVFFVVNKLPALCLVILIGQSWMIAILVDDLGQQIGHGNGHSGIIVALEDTCWFRDVGYPKIFRLAYF